MADYFTVDQRRLHVIPDELDWRLAAFIEPLGTPVHASRLVGGLAGKERWRSSARARSRCSR